MAEKSEKAALAAAALILGLGLVNYAFAYLAGYPFLYCAARPIMPLLAGLFHWLWLASLLAFVVSLFGSGMSRATVQALGLFFLAQLIPTWAGTLFGLGLSC